MADLLGLPTGFNLNVVNELGRFSEKSDEEDELKEHDQNETTLEHKKPVDQPSQDWQLNVLVKFNVNPSEAMTFQQDTKSKRVVVTDTKEGLEVLKGMPICAIDEQDVSSWTSFMLEDMWKTITLPTVVQFGVESVEPERVISTASLQSSEDHISFLGQTASMVYDDEEVKEESTYDDILDSVPEVEESSEIELMDLKPISFDGTLGDQSSWSTKCKQRAQIITELLNTEKSYIRGLEELNFEFLEPFVQPLKKSTHVDISSFQIKIETLIHLHDKIYEKFCNAENICSVFQQEFAFLRMYKPYIKDYEETLRKLVNAQNKRAFKSIFKNSKSVSCNPLGYFQARGITIVQRPPRYILLLRQLKKRTPLEHPMYHDLEKGLKEIEGTCGDINEYQRQLENEHKLFELSVEIDLKSLNEHGIKELVVPARRLIRVGEVAIVKIKHTSMSFLRRSHDESLIFELGRVVMCNDILIIFRGKKNRVCRVFKLATIEVEVNKNPIKPLNKYHKFEKIFQVLLRKRNAEEIKQMHKARDIERLSLMNTGRSDSGRSVVSLAQASLSIENDNEEDFSIYLSTLDEAEQWQRSIFKYSNSQYVN